MSETGRPAVVLHPIHPPGLADEVRRIEGIELVTPEPSEVEAALASGADGLISYQWENWYLDHRIRWIQAVSAGTDQFPFPLIDARGVVLTSARGAHSPAVADHAVALIFALLRRIGPAVRRSVEHVWQTEMAYESEGLTVGIIGLGSIGDAIAHRLLALGLRVVGCKRHPDRYHGPVEQVVGPADIESVFTACDVVVITLPHTDETEGLIRRSHLTSLNGWLVNVGRGAVIDEGALAAAITAGDVRGAALDVTTVEPLPPDSPLWEMDEVIITPHMAWASDRLAARLTAIIEPNVAALRGEGDWVNRVER